MHQKNLTRRNTKQRMANSYHHYNGETADFERESGWKFVRLAAVAHVLNSLVTKGARSYREDKGQAQKQTPEENPASVS